MLRTLSIESLLGYDPRHKSSGFYPHAEAGGLIRRFPSTQGKEAVLEANKTFFTSIQSMQHRLDNIWQVENGLICHGEVNYIRLDQTKTSTNFATILKLEDDKIVDYLVYADLSQL